MVFHQAAAPLGWTITADNDKLLRVTTSVGADGGTNSISASGLTTGNESTHTHPGSSTHADHTHTIPGTDPVSEGGQDFGFENSTSTTGGVSAALTHDSTGAGTAHNHAMDPDFAYTDCIIASKD
jgi:hypothetical protein